MFPFESGEKSCEGSRSGVVKCVFAQGHSPANLVPRRHFMSLVFIRESWSVEQLLSASETTLGLSRREQVLLEALLCPSRTLFYPVLWKLHLWQPQYELFRSSKWKTKICELLRSARLFSLMRLDRDKPCGSETRKSCAFLDCEGVLSWDVLGRVTCLLLNDAPSSLDCIWWAKSFLREIVFSCGDSDAGMVEWDWSFVCYGWL